jgi:hypothetical protein
MLTTYCPLHHMRQEVTLTASFKISTKKVRDRISDKRE